MGSRAAVARMSDEQILGRLVEPRTELHERSAPLRSESAMTAAHVDTIRGENSLLAAEDADRLQQAVEIVQSLSPNSPDTAADAAAHRLLGIAPRDAIERMLATQMLALHSAVLDCARRAMLPGQDGATRREELNLGAKASRACAHLADTFDRRRRGGKQKVIVEHVHVHTGGQAIVGDVHVKRPGLSQKSEG